MKEHLLNLIADGKLKEALDAMRQIEHTQSKYFKDPVISLLSRYTRNERDQNGGTIDSREYKVEFNKIEVAVKSLLDSELEESKISTDLKLKIIENSMPPTAAEEKRGSANNMATMAPIHAKEEVQAVLKILMLTAIPAKTSSLDVHKEFSQINLKLQNHRKDFDPIVVHNVNIDEFREKVDAFKPHILHFSGHGIDREDKVGLVLQNEFHNGYELLNPKQLDILFKYFSSQFKIEAVILNACLSGKQAQVIAKYVPYVAGTQVQIEDEYSIAFSTGFYFKLVESNQDYGASFRSARTVAELKGADANDFVFYKDGELWNIDSPM